MVAGWLEAFGWSLLFWLLAGLDNHVAYNSAQLNKLMCSPQDPSVRPLITSVLWRPKEMANHCRSNLLGLKLHTVSEAYVDVCGGWGTWPGLATMGGPAQPITAVGFQFPRRQAPARQRQCPAVLFLPASHRNTCFGASWAQRHRSFKSTKLMEGG